MAKPKKTKLDPRRPMILGAARYVAEQIAEAISEKIPQSEIRGVFDQALSESPDWLNEQMPFYSKRALNKVLNADTLIAAYESNKDPETKSDISNVHIFSLLSAVSSEVMDMVGGSFVKDMEARTYLNSLTMSFKADVFSLDTFMGIIANPVSKMVTSVNGMIANSVPSYDEPEDYLVRLNNLNDLVMATVRQWLIDADVFGGCVSDDESA